MLFDGEDGDQVDFHTAILVTWFGTIFLEADPACNVGTWRNAINTLRFQLPRVPRPLAFFQWHRLILRRIEQWVLNCPWQATKVRPFKSSPVQARPKPYVSRGKLRYEFLFVSLSGKVWKACRSFPFYLKDNTVYLSCNSTSNRFWQIFQKYQAQKQALIFKQIHHPMNAPSERHPIYIDLNLQYVIRKDMLFVLPRRWPGML